MSTIREVASRAGVSTAAVSLYLNGKAKGRVSQAKQLQIEEAVKELNYQTSSSSRPFRRVATGQIVYTIAIYWASDSRSALLGKVMSGIQEAILKHRDIHLNIVICPYKVNELYKEESLIKPELYNYDALIIANTAIMDMQYLSSITPVRPIVLLNRKLPQYSSVFIDNEKMGADLSDLIIKKGHKSVSVFRTYSSFIATNDRVSGFIEGCRANGLELPNDALFYTQNSIDGGIETAKKFLRLSTRPDVIFCDSDAIALGTLYYFHQTGIKVPEHVSVVSIGMYHSSTTRCSIPPLTVSEVPLQQMAAGCIECLMEILTKKSTHPIQRQLETSILERASLK